MNIAVAYATLSGNTLAVALELQAYLSSQGHSATLLDTLEVPADQLKHYDLVFIGSSTYGDGDLNPIAEYFFGAAAAHQHVCDHTKFAIFALGDSSYQHFAESGSILHTKLTEMGADILLPVLTLDGNPDATMLARVRAWAEEVLTGASE